MYSVLSPETSLDNGVTLEPMSMVPLGTALPPNTAWEGVPVQPKSQKKVKKSAGDRLRGIRATLPRGQSGGHHRENDVEPVQGTPLLLADLQKAQCAGFLVTVLASWVAFLPMSIGIVKHYTSDSSVRGVFHFYIIFETFFQGAP